jgi:hypothetical protein
MKVGSFALILGLAAHSPGISPQEKKNEIIPAGDSTIFDRLKTILAQKTKVPVRLPAYLPEHAEKDRSLFVILERADKTGYTVEVAMDPECGEAQHVCYFAYLEGSARPIPENGGRRHKVALQGGITGYVIAETCGAHCDGSAVGWKEGGYYYRIQFKAESKVSLIKVANSAIADSKKRGSR